MPDPAIPCSSTPARPLPGARTALAFAIAWARPTNRSGSGGNSCIATSAGSRSGFPCGTSSTSPAWPPSSTGVASDSTGRAGDGSGPAARATARASATSSG